MPFGKHLFLNTIKELFEGIEMQNSPLDSEDFRR